MDDLRQENHKGLATVLAHDRRMIIVALVVFAADQITKAVVNLYLKEYNDEKIIIAGFFKFVHWGNTGAAWSLFTNRNGLLAIVGIVALFVLFRSRRHFDIHTKTGQFALGLIFGGILGNLVERVFRHQVTDFLYFYMDRRGGGPIGFPAFNIADSAICIGVGLIFISTLKNNHSPVKPPAA